MLSLIEAISHLDGPYQDIAGDHKGKIPLSRGLEGAADDGGVVGVGHVQHGHRQGRSAALGPGQLGPVLSFFDGIKSKLIVFGTASVAQAPTYNREDLTAAIDRIANLSVVLERPRLLRIARI